ncbi:5-dehydro-4-deoxy-D-glucuronate isomerase [bacterium]|nr:MAG: 5-dehydro-4-deoxy-D-glucuronate isomerase [bacterium]
MEVRYLPNDVSYQRMTTGELRGAFALENLFEPGLITLVYSDSDRAIVGGAVPVAGPLPLLATQKEMAARHFNERRELGIMNIGGEGTVSVDGTRFVLGFRDLLYAGKGVQGIEFSSKDAAAPAVFYLVSFPAHTTYPTSLMRFSDAERSLLGSASMANKRTICKYVHAGGIKSCQLVMGMTELEEGSVWNTMPPHTHQRRSEIYLYFNLDPNAMVVHLMGKPNETRNLILRNRQAVLSPPWSIHAAAATKNYAFIWAMGGENQEFSDMDAIAPGDIL